MSSQRKRGRADSLTFRSQRSVEAESKRDADRRRCAHRSVSRKCELGRADSFSGRSVQRELPTVAAGTQAVSQGSDRTERVEVADPREESRPLVSWTDDLDPGGGRTWRAGTSVTSHDARELRTALEHCRSFSGTTEHFPPTRRDDSLRDPRLFYSSRQGSRTTRRLAIHGLSPRYTEL